VPLPGAGDGSGLAGGSSGCGAELLVKELQEEVSRKKEEQEIDRNSTELRIIQALC